MAAPQTSIAPGRVAFTYPSFGFYQLARFCIVLATEMQSVAVGWQVYEITTRPLDLGLVGLAQFLPGVLLFLVSGHVADRYDRRKLVLACYAAFGGCSALLLFAALRHTRSVYPIYGVVILIGIVRAFNAPVSRALLPQLVPEQHFPNAVAWASSVFQTATILGPSAGGVVYAIARGPSAVYGLAAVAATVATFCAFQIKVESKARSREPLNTSNVLAGLHYIWRKKIILGAISLDLFAVLLGGAVALLPVYAREILMTGPWGLHPAERAGNWRGDDGRVLGSPAVARAGGSEDVVVRGRVWCVHDFVWGFPQFDPFTDRARARGGCGHG